MANRTAWTAGNSASGLGWQAMTVSATLAAGSAQLDAADVANATNLDLFADISVSCTTASATYSAGMCLSFYIYALNQDGTTYGDNHLTTTAAAVVPAMPAAAVIPLFIGATQTSIVGHALQIPLPPGNFRWAIANNGVTLTAATVKFRTYNTNLNN
jgi:hypothetical protein